MKINIPKLKEKASERPQGYVEDVLSRGVIHGDFLEIDPVQYRALLDKYNPEQKTPISSCCGKKEMPPLTTQVKNAFNAAGRVIGAALTGEPVRRPKEEQERVQAICASNECGFYNATSERCMKCGCTLGIPLINKTAWATEKCPVGKW